MLLRKLVSAFNIQIYKPSETDAVNSVIVNRVG